MNSKLKPASSRFKATSTRSKRIPSASRSEEHTSELQSLTNLVCRLFFEKKEHTSELQSLTNLVCRLLLEKKNTTNSYISRATGSACHLQIADLAGHQRLTYGLGVRRMNE